MPKIVRPPPLSSSSSVARDLRAASRAFRRRSFSLSLSLSFSPPGRAAPGAAPAAAAAAAFFPS
eukprot:CAMPEP_0174898520 /NCGR_PEP_ID=MMETSP0167-20121228/21926_1 /TAXON_ID=38298 /ORGANISM="Rhodella maculata, Strain CCMP736" /LENGTH=63 /DNA_ID=CAMNT_0016139157 /DNA_START=545 /DNA_END=733 /DNA_ORIENTATION=+